MSRGRGTGRPTGRPPTHGGSRTAEYRSWNSMKQRCENPAHHAYAEYGGRGISVCDRWRESFEAFLADMGRRPSLAHSIERINNGKGYEPGNCRWATPAEQQRNTRLNRVLTFQGETLCLMDWAQKLGIKFNTLHERLRRGWSVEKTLSAPVGGKR